MLKISYKEQKTNEEVLNMVNSKRQLLSIIAKRKCKYFGHIIRQNSLQRQLLEGKNEGKRGRGRPRATWIDNIKYWTKKSYVQLVRMPMHRDEFRRMTSNVFETPGT